MTYVDVIASAVLALIALIIGSVYNAHMDREMKKGKNRRD